MKSAKAGTVKNVRVTKCVGFVSKMSKKREILKALDSLGLALANDGHVWTNEERKQYNRAVNILQ